MNTYDPHTTLDAISHNAVAVIGIGGLSIIAMFVFFIEAARMGRRDRVYPMALWMTALWWPHDGSYLLHFSDWFGGPYDHWFMQLFWFAIVVTFLAECIYAWQTIQYGRNELSPGRSQRRACPSDTWRDGRRRDQLGFGQRRARRRPLPALLHSDVVVGRPGGQRDARAAPRRTGPVLARMDRLQRHGSLLFDRVDLFFGGGFFHSWPYIGICMAACVWSFVIIADTMRAGVPLTSWRPRTASSQPHGLEDPQQPATA